jgi:hypothetical protein
MGSRSLWQIEPLTISVQRATWVLTQLEHDVFYGLGIARTECWSSRPIEQETTSAAAAMRISFSVEIRAHMGSAIARTAVALVAAAKITSLIATGGLEVIAQAKGVRQAARTCGTYGGIVTANGPFERIAIEKKQAHFRFVVQKKQINHSRFDDA